MLVHQMCHLLTKAMKKGFYIFGNDGCDGGDGGELAVLETCV